MKKAQAAQEKEKRKQETQARLAAEEQARKAADFASEHYGKSPLNMSQSRPRLSWINIGDLDAEHEGRVINIQARVHNARGTGMSLALCIPHMHTLTLTDRQECILNPSYGQSNHAGRGCCR